MLAPRLPCARTLTLLLALLGIASHVRLYVVLGELQESFPYVPNSSSSVLKSSALPPLPLSALGGALDNSTHPAAAAWYNILPARPSSRTPAALIVSPSTSQHSSAPAPAAQERSTWEAARLVTRTMRGYAAMSAAAAAAGAWGVLAVSICSALDDSLSLASERWCAMPEGTVM
jgi:hypothetical protein